MSYQRCLLTICVVGTAAASQLAAAIIREDVDPSAYRTLAASPRFDAVGRFWENYQGIEWFATAVLVAPDWVMTAKHVPGFDGSINIGFELGDQLYEISRVVDHPTDDLALVQLSTPVTDVNPARLYLGDDEIGQTAVIVGYGDFGRSNEPEPALGSNRGPKWAGTNVIDGISADFPSIATPTLSHLMFDFDYPNDSTKNLFGDATSLSLEFMAANGESGGPWYITVGGVDYVAGITSWGNPRDVPKGAMWTSAVRTSEYTDWVNNYFAVPEPSGLKLALFGIFAAIGASTRMQLTRKTHDKLK